MAKKSRSSKVKNFFATPTNAQIRKDKEVKSINSYSTLINQLLNRELDSFGRTYLEIHFQTLPLNARKKKYPAISSKRDEKGVFDFTLSKRNPDNPIYLENFNNLGVLKSNNLRRFLHSFGISYHSNKINAKPNEKEWIPIYITPLDVIRAEKLIALSYVSPSKSEVTRVKPFGDYVEADVVIPAFRLNERPYEFTISKFPVNENLGSISLADIEFTSLSKNRDSSPRNAYHYKGIKIWSPQQIAGLNVLAEHLEKEGKEFNDDVYFKKITPIFLSSQMLIKAYDIITKHLLINNDGKRRLPIEFEINNFLMGYILDFFSKNSPEILSSVDKQGNSLTLKEKVFEIYYNKDRIRGFYDSQQYSNPQKMTLLRP